MVHGLLFQAKQCLLLPGPDMHWRYWPGFLYQTDMTYFFLELNEQLFQLFDNQFEEMDSLFQNVCLHVAPFGVKRTTDAKSSILFDFLRKMVSGVRLYSIDWYTPQTVITSSDDGTPIPLLTEQNHIQLVRVSRTVLHEETLLTGEQNGYGVYMEMAPHISFCLPPTQTRNKDLYMADSAVRWTITSSKHNVTTEKSHWTRASQWEISTPWIPTEILLSIRKIIV